MIGLIPFIANDFILTGVYIGIAVLFLYIRPEKNDLVAYAFGLIGLTISETLFVSTGVETFIRNSFFGIMPLWLPFIWAYAFVVIQRSLRILEN